MEPIEIGQRIRDFRVKKGWSQAVLAQRASIRVSDVLEIERGGTVAPSLLLKIADALNIHVSLLATEKWLAETESLLSKVKSQKSVLNPPLTGDSELVFEIEVPEGATNDEVIALAGRLALEADTLHRLEGGHGLMVERLEIEQAAPVCEGVPRG